MIKLVFVLRRKPGLSREEFQRYWRDHHAQLLLERAETFGVKRYVQVHTVETPFDGALRSDRHGEPYDGVAELWWDSLEEFAAVMGSEDGQAAGRDMLADERNFIDLENSAIWLAEEHQVVG
jgi:uncharacterized protein (TIGR02118 family)